MTGFNIGCIDDIDTFKFSEVIVNDGKNHPLDDKKNAVYKPTYNRIKKYFKFVKSKNCLNPSEINGTTIIFTFQ